MVAPQPFFRSRGTPFSVLHRIRALLRLGHTVDLVTYPFGESPELPGLRIVRTPRPPTVRDVPIGPSFAKLLLDGPLFARTRTLAASGTYDLLHTHEEAGVLGAWLARRLGITHLYDMHSSLPQQFGNFGRFDWGVVVGMFRRLERYTLAGSHGVIAICPELRDHVQASGYPGPVALIENTLDFEPPAVQADDVDRLRKRLELGEGPAVVYTGTLEAYQGLELLLASAGEVLRRIPTARFVLVGGTVAQHDALRDRARALGVESAFRFVPSVAPTEVFLYHRLAAVLVTTRSRGTNTPLKIYQYLRAARPIVATNIHSHTQVLTPESAELVVPDPSAIASGLIRVLTDPERATTLAEAAERSAREHYGEERYLDRLHHVLASTVRHKRGGMPA